MRIGILASPENRITDYYLGSQLIRSFDVPIILVQKKARPRRPQRWLRLAHRVITQNPAATLSYLRDRYYEQNRQQTFSACLSRYFAQLGEQDAYDPGPEIISVDDVHAPESLQLLRDRGVTLLFQNGAGIIRRPLIGMAKDGILNVHHGYLPHIRGCHSIAWGLLENRPEWIGVSVHLIDEGIDTGTILDRDHLSIRPDSTYESLFCEATVRGGQLLVETVQRLVDGNQRIIPRDDIGTYRPAMTRCQWETLRGHTPRLNPRIRSSPSLHASDRQPVESCACAAR